MDPIVLTPQGDHVPLEEGCVVLEEARHYEVRFPGTGVDAARLGAVTLPVSSQGGFAIWVGHAIGSSTLEADCAGMVRQWPVRVEPRAEKLPSSLWLAMVTELETWVAGTSVGLEGPRHGSVGLEGVSLPLLVESLLPLLPSLETALRRLLARPRDLQLSRLIDVPLHATRKVTRETVSWVGRHPTVARWFDPWQAAELDELEPSIPYRHNHDSLDHPANRYVSWLIQRVIRTLDAATVRLAGFASGSDEGSRWCEARATRLGVGASRLRALWRRSFLAGLRREPASEAALLVVVDDPVYARVHQIGRRFLSPMFRLDGEATDPQAPVAPSFSIYELWCFFAVARQLESVLSADRGWELKTTGLNALVRTGGTGAGARLDARHASHGEIGLQFNPTFTGYLNRGETTDRWSLSGERRPDLVVTWRSRDRTRSWLCLDAKYRAGRSNLAEAFESVHIYRDALRYPAYGGACAAAMLLAPSSATDVEAWFSRDFRTRYQCGIWELRPGMPDGDGLARWITRTLGVPS